MKDNGSKLSTTSSSVNEGQVMRKKDLWKVLLGPTEKMTRIIERRDVICLPALMLAKVGEKESGRTVRNAAFFSCFNFFVIFFRSILHSGVCDWSCATVHGPARWTCRTAVDPSRSRLLSSRLPRLHDEVPGDAGCEGLCACCCLWQRQKLVSLRVLTRSKSTWR